MLEVALNFLNKIEEHGFEAYIVGGFVRDYLLGIEENEDNCSFRTCQRLIARNAKNMSRQEKKELIELLFTEE